MSKLSILCGVVLAIANVALAENWPQFRGPNGQGISAETNLPVKWSATENIAWRVEIPGLGWSSPIIWGDRIFLTTATEGGVGCHVMCLDRASGKVLWDKQVFQQQLKRKEQKNSYATPTPVTDGQLVYAAFNDGSLCALDFDGNIAWINRDVPFYSQHGLGASPIIYEDLLIQPRDASSETGDKYVGWQKPWDKSFILALDKKTGKEKWRGKRGMSRIAHVTPCIWRDGDKAQLISAAGDVVQGHDLASGELIWTSYGAGEGVVPSVVLGDGVVYNATGFTRTTIRATKLGGKGDVTKTHVLWNQTTGAPTMSSFVLAKGYLFAVKEDGMAVCLDQKTGQVVWKQRLRGQFSPSPIFADGKIYFLSEQGEATVIEPGPQYKPIAVNRVEEECQASFAVSGGQIFLRTGKALYCIGKR